VNTSKTSIETSQNGRWRKMNKKSPTALWPKILGEQQTICIRCKHFHIYPGLNEDGAVSSFFYCIKENKEIDLMPLYCACFRLERGRVDRALEEWDEFKISKVK
jgi:hypothetical protein